MRYYLISGEPSGDLHGRALEAALRKADPQAEIRFRDASRMTPVMGIFEVLRHLGPLLRRRRDCRREIRTFAPDVFIPIDNPGFNLPLARFAHRRGCRVYYYIAPKLWARAAGRIRRLRRDTDRLYVLFPFETAYFTLRGVEARYFGNPLPGQIRSALERQRFVPTQGKKPIALLPGSRDHEIRWLMPRFAALEQLMSGDSRWDGYELVVAAAPGRTEAQYRAFLGPESRIRIVCDATYALLEASRSALVCSGTASLETALMGTPQAVCYGFHPLTWQIAKRIVHSRFVSLANLILDKEIFRELLQENAAPEKLLEELSRITFDGEVRARMADDYATLRDQLDRQDCLDRIAADIVAG